MIRQTINEEYQAARDRHRRELEEKKREVYRRAPQIRQIDEEIAAVSVEISRTLIESGADPEAGIAHLKNQIDRLKRKRQDLLNELDLPVDFLSMHYDCERCKDTGLDGGQRCRCYRAKVIHRAYEMSNLQMVLDRENFAHFDETLFSATPDPSEGMSPRDNIRSIRQEAESFTRRFDEENRHLLFYGNTGLGKTYLCNAIAKDLLDRGISVVYQTAFELVETLGDYRFSRDTSDRDRLRYRLLFDADLLIIDDLGTELTNAFTNTELFNIINRRLLSKKSMIISTNLSPAEIVSTYTDRISSRIFGSFELYKFFGPDLRWEARK